MGVGAEFRICEGISGVPVVTVLGDLDESTVRAFHDVLEVAVHRCTRGLIVDLEPATSLCDLAYETLAHLDSLFAADDRPLIVVRSEDDVTGTRLLPSSHIRVPTLVAALRAVRTLAAHAAPLSA